MKSFVFVCALFWMCVACGGPDATSSGVLETGDAGLPVSDARPAAQCQDEPCSCVGAVGMRRCDASGQLGMCECPDVRPIDAGAVTVDSCPVGRYEGNFEGMAGFLIATGEVSGLSLFEDAPPLQITLSAPPGTAELEVTGDGIMHGNANGFFPFEARIKGKLDCTSKKFTATLSGSVQLVIDGIANEFTGTMESSYDANARAFKGGAWTVTGDDTNGADLGLTGSGTWDAEYRGADAGSDGGGR
jgi:hypothetical protein